MKIKILTNNEVYQYPGLPEAILQMNGRLDLPNRFWFVIINGTQWVGYGGYRKIDNERVYSGPTFIKEEFRGKGLQRKLIRARIAQAKKDGYKESVSCVDNYNHHSGNNLIAEGYRMTSIPSYYDIEQYEVWFKRKL